MNPDIFEEEPTHSSGMGFSPFKLLRGMARRTWGILLWRPVVLVSRPVDPSPLWVRVVRGTIYRLSIIPFLIAILVAAFVWTGSHPAEPPVGSDPTALGLHYDPITILSGDGVRLEGWIVPVLDARVVLQERDRALNRSYGAVVLVHDQGMSPAQMLPLVRPLHDAGLVVLAIGLRGTGTYDPAAQTFGLRESGDVIAAVEMLRRRQYIDPHHIGVMGIGTGATAALLSLEQDSQITTVVLDALPTDTDAILRKIGPKNNLLGFLRPLCQKVFEAAYDVDLEDVVLSGHSDSLKGHPVLILPAESGATVFPASRIQQICLYLSLQLHVAEPPLTRPLQPVLR